MIYLFTGSDGAKTRAKAFAWVAAAREKQPDAPYVRLSVEQVSEGSLASLVTSQGLFFSKTLGLIDDPFALKESGELVMDALDSLAASDNPIAIVAPKLLATQAKKLEAKAAKVFTSESVKKPSRGFNGALVNALGSKDGVSLWKEIVKAERLGDAPEMIHGLLHWKARDLMEKGGRAWTEEEARELSLELIELLSDSRSGVLDLGKSLERFALSFAR